MEARHKRYLKINLVSLVFVAVSFISVTLAWFAYSGLANANVEIGVKAWYIELEKDGESVSNDIVISLSDIYPGMDTVTETVSVKNLGDSDALLRYEIVSSRIFDEETIIDQENPSEKVENALSHDYPFHINMSISKNYILAKNGEETFNVSLSWPLDTGSEGNNTDSEWGKNAYNFQDNENNAYLADNTYQKRPSIQVVISVVAEQYLADDNTSDARYDLGEEILFDPVANTFCTELTGNCIKTYVIDRNNKIGDETVTLLPDLSRTYNSGSYINYEALLNNYSNIDNWTATLDLLTIDNVLDVTSKDVINTVLSREGISDVVVGNLSYNDKMTATINNTIENNGYYKFKNTVFPYLTSSTCYWLKSEYGIDKAFAIETIDENDSKISGRLKTDSCSVIPIIVVSKFNQ